MKSKSILLLLFLGGKAQESTFDPTDPVIDNPFDDLVPEPVVPDDEISDDSVPQPEPAPAKPDEKVVDIETQDNNDYTGPLYAGQHFAYNKVIYDTMVSWTSINVQGSRGAIMEGTYDQKKSNTSDPLYTKVWNPQTNDYNDMKLQKSLKFGETQMDGMLTKDQMCLYQPNIQDDFNKTLQTGSLCVSNHTFVAVERIKGGEFAANGILGLAPTAGEESFVAQLKAQGAIDKEIVSINLQNPHDKKMPSTIAFGEIDHNMIVGGESRLNYYSNVGQNRWALLMDHLQYGQQSLRDQISADDEADDFSNTKIALIDTGNSSIQIPDSEFQNLKRILMSQEDTFREKDLGKERSRLMTPMRCEDIEKRLSEFDFHIQNTKITIHPRGYLFTSDDGHCHVGIESIPDELNQFRLGTIFLRNFYTVFDYQHNLILLGLNKEGSEAEQATIQGNRVENPFVKPTEDEQVPEKSGGGGFATFLILVLLGIIGAFSYHFYEEDRKKKLNQQQRPVADEVSPQVNPSINDEEADRLDSSQGLIS